MRLHLFQPQWKVCVRGGEIIVIIFHVVCDTMGQDFIIIGFHLILMKKRRVGQQSRQLHSRNLPYFILRGSLTRIDGQKL